MEVKLYFFENYFGPATKYVAARSEEEARKSYIEWLERSGKKESVSWEIRRVKGLWDDYREIKNEEEVKITKSHTDFGCGYPGYKNTISIETVSNHCWEKFGGPLIYPRELGGMSYPMVNGPVKYGLLSLPNIEGWVDKIENFKEVMTFGEFKQLFEELIA